MTFSRMAIVCGLIFAAVCALIFVRPDLPWTLPIAAAEQAAGIDRLFLIMLVVSAGIFIFVQGFLLYFAWIYRRRPTDAPDALGRNLHGDNRLELAWTIAPALIVVVITVLTFQEMEALQLNESPETTNGTAIDVMGLQFAWSFAYPDTGIEAINTLTLQKDQTYTLRITAQDVTHAFWVPAFRLKQDATPGYFRYITITPNMTHQEAARQTGNPDYEAGFPLRCAELCGSGHSAMIARVQVLEPAAYEQWQQDKITAMSAEADGETVYGSHPCASCHQLDVVGAVGAVGPTHNGLGATAEARIAAPDYTGSATTALDYIKESIRNPNVYIAPEYPAAMPPYPPEQISDAELDALAQFLLEQ